MFGICYRTVHVILQHTSAQTSRKMVEYFYVGITEPFAADVKTKHITAIRIFYMQKGLLFCHMCGIDKQYSLNSSTFMSVHLQSFQLCQSTKRFFDVWIDRCEVDASSILKHCGDSYLAQYPYHGHCVSVSFSFIITFNCILVNAFYIFIAQDPTTT